MLGLLCSGIYVGMFGLVPVALPENVTPERVSRKGSPANGNYVKRKNGNLIEERAYHTVYGIWTYFTADDGQVNLADSDYLGIGTLESFKKMRKYYGEDAVCPVYVQVEDGERLSRALNREREQENPRYEEMCRRFIADQSDFSEENILNAGIEKRFQNINLDDCVKEIANYIKSVQ